MKPWFVSPLQFLMGWFGYAKIPIEAVQLAMKIKFMAAEADHMEIYDGAKALEDLLRACRRLGI